MKLTHLPRLATIGLLLSLVVACNFQDRSSLHPNPSRLPSDNLVNFTIDLEEDRIDFFQELVYDFKNPNKQKIGDDSLLSNNYYGVLPYQFDIDKDGNIYIVQWATSSINVYDSTGVFKYSIGKPGRGPGEFLKISSFDFNEDYSKLYVLDWPEVEVFKVSNNRYEYETSFIHNLLYSNDICILDENIFISGYKTSTDDTLSLNSYKSINKYDLNTFSFHSSFGFEYLPNQNQLNYKRIMSSTFIACNKETNTIVGQLKYFPYMFGYDLYGKTKWVSRITNYVSTEFIEKNEPSLALGTNDDIYNNFFHFRNTDLGKYELIQIGHLLPSSYISSMLNGENPKPIAIEDPKYYTLLVDSETGELAVSPSYDLIGAAKNGLIITITVEENSLSPNNSFYVQESKN